MAAPNAGNPGTDYVSRKAEYPHGRKPPLPGNPMHASNPMQSGRRSEHPGDQLTPTLEQAPAVSGE